MDTRAATRPVHPRRPLYAWRGTSYRASCPSVSTRPRDVLNGGRAAGTALYVSQNGGKSAASQAATWSFRAVTARPQCPGGARPSRSGDPHRLMRSTAQRSSRPVLRSAAPVRSAAASCDQSRPVRSAPPADDQSHRAGGDQDCGCDRQAVGLRAGAGQRAPREVAGARAVTGAVAAAPVAGCPSAAGPARGRALTLAGRPVVTAIAGALAVGGCQDPVGALGRPLEAQRAAVDRDGDGDLGARSEEHTSELQSR